MEALHVGNIHLTGQPLGLIGLPILLLPRGCHMPPVLLLQLQIPVGIGVVEVLSQTSARDHTAIRYCTTVQYCAAAAQVRAAAQK